jgi:hypothetical protein
MNSFFGKKCFLIIKNKNLRGVLMIFLFYVNFIFGFGSLLLVIKKNLEIRYTYIL